MSKAKKGSLGAHQELARFHGGENHQGIKHMKVIASAGDKDSMDFLMTKYRDDLMSKDDLAQTLRIFQDSSNAMKSGDRDDFRLLRAKGMM